MAFLFLIIYVVALLVRPHEWGINPAESSLIRNSLIICMLVFLVFNRHKNLLAPQFALMLAFTVSVAFSLVSIGWLGGAMEYGIDFITTALIPFILVSGILNDIKKQTIIFSLIVIAAMIMVVNGHVQATSETGLGLAGNPIFIQSGVDKRITYLGYFEDPNDLGMFFVMTLPILVYVMVAGNPLVKTISFICICFIGYGIYLTNSRGTLLATLALVGLWFYRKYGMVKSIQVGLVCSPVLLFVISRFRSISVEDSSSQGRLDAWYEGFQMFYSNPLFGVGNNMFLDYHNQTAHNSFVLVLAELGLFGCLIWTGILIITFYLLFRIARMDFVPPDMPTDDFRMVLAVRESKIALTLFYSFVAFSVSGFFLSRAYTPLLYLFIGMSAACWGRVHAMFPEAGILYEPKKIATLTLLITTSALVAIYILLKIGL